MEDHREIEPALEHSSRVYCVAISPSGAVLASGGRDGDICLWSVPDSLQRRDTLPRDLTGCVFRVDDYPTVPGMFANTWRCTLSTSRGSIWVCL